MNSVAMLDRSLVRHGQTITITRAVAGARPLVATTKAFVRGYQPEELTDDIFANDRKAIVSPTGLPFEPAELDRVLIAGTSCNVQAADLIRDGNSIVRIELQVRG